MTATIGRDTNVGEFESWGFPAWSFDDFHRRELPRRLAEGVNEQVTWDLVDAPPFAVACSGGGGGGRASSASATVPAPPPPAPERLVEAVL